MPTVVIVAKDKAGKDTSKVRVTIDGELVAEQLDGRPLTIDPGAHQVQCEHMGQTRVEDVVITQGKKDRAITCSFEEKVIEDAPVEEGAPTGQLVAGVVIGVLALGGIGAFAALGTIGKSEASDLEIECAAETERCSEENISATENKLLAADISLIAGAALGAVSLGLIIHYIVSQPDEDDADAVRVDVGPMVGGAFGQITVSF